MNMNVSFDEASQKSQNSSAFGIGFNGMKIENGKDGISATHRWEGTTLTITSASGSSSANLKGDRGEDGLDGKDGANGKDGGSIYKVGRYWENAGAYSGDLSMVELPEGRSLQAGDFLLHEDGTLLQVTQIGNEEISSYWLGCAFILNTMGAQGPQGEKGEAGNSGVYVGSEADKPEDTRVLVDPNANEELVIPEVLQSTGDSEEDTMSQKAITAGLSKIPAITQESGSSESLVMSQKAVTDLIADALAVRVPDYWQDAVDTATDKVKALQDAGGKDVVNFAWLSDLHYGGDKTYIKNIGIVAAAVMDGCGIPLALMNGDTLTAGVFSTEDQVLTSLDGAVKDILAPIGEERLLLVRGNHDDVYGTYTAEDGTKAYYVNKVAPSKMWNKLHRWQAKDFRRVLGGDGTYLYLDNIPQKVRFVCLNGHFYDGEGVTAGTSNFMTFAMGETQLDWLENTALAVEDGWSVVLAIHVPPTNHNINGRTNYLTHFGNDGTTLRNIITAKADNIIALFCGHCHADAIVSDDLPFPIVTITCAINTPYDAAYSTRVPNSTNETAFDIVSINKAAKTIHMTRLGYGSDRVVGYGGTEVVTYSVTNTLTNCTNSNSTTMVEEGSAYSATIAANSGYVLDSVSVTMGGSAVTVTDGMINIESVTGDIVITATAVADETETTVTNLYDKSQATLNTRYSFSSSAFTASDGTFATGWVELPANAAENEVYLYTKGLNLVSCDYGCMIGTDNPGETSNFELSSRYAQLNDTTGAYSMLGEILDADTYYYKVRIGYNADGSMKNASGVSRTTHICITYQVGTTAITIDDLPDFVMSFEPIE